MKNLINWLIVALLFVCFDIKAQDPFLLSTTSAKLANTTAAPMPISPPSVQKPLRGQQAST